ncbi:putative ribonuclease H-like domain-containing protein [Tanacetum coccineum]
MKPSVTIFNTRDHLGKFDEKADEGFFVEYSIVIKAIRVFNKRTRIVEETLNIRFLENTPNVIRNGPNWLFDVNSLIISMNYVSVIAGNQTNGIAGTRDNIVTCQAEKKTEPKQEYILIPICTTDPLISQDPKVSEEDVEEKPTKMDESGASDKDGEDDQATRSDTPVSAAGPSFTNDDPSSLVNATEASNAFEEHLFERFSPFKNAFTLPPVSNVTPMDDTGIFGNAYDDEDVGAEADLNNLETTMNVSPIPTTRIDKDHPKDQIILHSAPLTRRMSQQNLKEHCLMDVKNAFVYGTIEEEVYVFHPPGFEYPHFLDKVYKVEKALYGLYQAPRAWYETLSTYLLENGFRRGTIDKILFIKKDKSDILLVQDKYVANILKKFDYVTIKTTSTPMEPNKALVKDEEVDNVDVHLYISMIGSLMCLTASSTLEDGDMGITATIDGKVKVVSEASIRRHLKLEDSDGISTLSTAEIFEQLALIGVRLYRVKDQQSQLIDKTAYGVAYTQLIIKVKKLEHKVKSIKARRKVRLVILEDEDDLEDPSNRGKMAQTVWKLQKKSCTWKKASRAAIYEEMDNIQARIEADDQLVARVQAEEQELYSIEEKS